MATLTIRRATPADRPSLRKAYVELQEHERRLHASRLPGEEIADAYVERMIEQAADAGGVFVAERDGEFLGFAAGWVENSQNVAETADSNRFGYVSDICVLVAHRKRGIARRLLEAMTRMFVEAGVTRVRIGTLADNHLARLSYEGAGFRPYEVIYEKALSVRKS